MNIKIAIVHDWLTGMRGGEYVLEAIVQLFPQAELFTLLASPEKISPILLGPKLHTSWLQKISGAEQRYRHFLPLMPMIIQSFDLSDFDLVLSSSHCVAKGVKKGPFAVHVSYVHAPMRYMWDRFDDYFGPNKCSTSIRFAAKAVRKSLQKWDRKVSQLDRVDLLLSNSEFIADQIQDHYGRSSEVVYPFADLSRFTLPRNATPNYLIVSAFAPYKRLDLAIEAFNEMKLPLRIVGSGQDDARLRQMAGPYVQFLGALSNEEVEYLYSTSRALIFPGVEDFGITPLESLASGTPVIAFRGGGAAETVDETCGIFFEEQTRESLIDAVQLFEENPDQFSVEDCQKRAKSFTKEKFQSEYYRWVRSVWIQAGKDAQQLSTQCSLK